MIYIGAFIALQIIVLVAYWLMKKIIRREY